MIPLNIQILSKIANTLQLLPVIRYMKFAQKGLSKFSIPNHNLFFFFHKGDISKFRTKSTNHPHHSLKQDERYEMKEHIN